MNILGLTYFSIYPLDPNSFPAVKYIARNIHFLFLINLIYTIIEGQFFWNKFTKKQLETIEKLKLDLEEKNNDILSSIRYARRIQASLLPTDKYIDKILSGNKTIPVTQDTAKDKNTEA